MAVVVASPRHGVVDGRQGLLDGMHGLLMLLVQVLLLHEMLALVRLQCLSQGELIRIRMRVLER